MPTTFYKLLANNAIASLTNMFIWFVLTFYVYLETRSVLATSIIGGSWAVISALSALYFGTYVDHHKKKTTMITSSIASLSLYFLAGIFYTFTTKIELLNLAGWHFWVFVFLIIAGAVAGNMRGIALATSVTLLVPEEFHAKANGLVGTVNGAVFAFTSVLGGLGVGFLGMGWAIVLTLILTFLVLIHIVFLKIEEKEIVHLEQPSKVDFKGAIQTILPIPGLMGLIFFATFNNFLGGVFMSLLDAYGLSLVSVETWGILLAFLSLGMIGGGIMVAKKGLGKNPVKLIFLVNIIMWIISALLAIQNSIYLLFIGMLGYMTLVPFIEASEQTVIQKVVPPEKQGRVFGFGQMIEQSASPLIAFMIGPIAQFWVIPFMSEGGLGADLIGDWFGVGLSRGIALIFVIAGLIGLVATLLAMKTKTYTALSKEYLK